MKPKTFIFSDDQKRFIVSRCAQLNKIASSGINSPMVIKLLSWPLFKSSCQNSVWRAVGYIIKTWWDDDIVNSHQVIRLREFIYHLRTGRDGSCLWDELVGDPPGSTQIDREEIKAIMQGRETSNKIQ